MEWEEARARVGNLRRERRLTRAQFGEMIGVSGQYVGKIERGAHKLSVDLVAKICKTTGVSADYILFGVVDPFAATSVLNDLSPTQMEIGLDILKRMVQMINTKNGNEALIQEVFRRQQSGGT